MSKRYTRQELLGADLVWLFRLTYAGRVFRWSSRPISLLTEEGQQLQVDGGLDEVDFQESFSLLSYEPDPRSVSLELLFPVSVAELEALGHSLVDAEGELSLIRVGDGEADRMALMKGLVRNPVWGGDDEPVSMTVQQPPWLDQGIFPSETQSISIDTWPNSGDSAFGKSYPVYFGNPGRIAGGKYNGAWGGQAYPLDADGVKLLICGTPIDMAAYEGEDIGFPLNTGYLTLDNLQSHQVTSPFNLEYMTDGLGQQVLIVHYENQADSSYTYIDHPPSIPGPDSPQTGIPTGKVPTSARVLRSAGLVTRYILLQGNVTLDHQRWEAVRPRMDQLKLDVAIMEHVDPGQWVVDNILPVLPISLVSGPDGVYPIWWDPDAPPVASIVAGDEVVRTSQVTAVRDITDCYTSVVLDYAKDYRSSAYAYRVTLSGESADSSTVDLRRRSTRQGGRTYKMSTDVVYEQVQAEWVAAWKAKAVSEPVNAVTYEVGLEWGWLEPGMVVELTDADMRFDGLRCLVGTMDWGLNTLGITLTFGSR